MSFFEIDIRSIVLKRVDLKDKTKIDKQIVALDSHSDAQDANT